MPEPMSGSCCRDLHPASWAIQVLTPRLGGVFIGIERAPLPGRLPSAQAQVLSRHFAAALHDDLVTDAGSFGQVGVARLLNGRNVYEYILTYVVRFAGRSKPAEIISRQALSPMSLLVWRRKRAPRSGRRAA